MTDMNNNKILVNLKKKIIEVRHGLRRLTFGKRLKPSFVIVGAQKAGTTSLYRYLIQHPNIKSSLLKEIHYFDLNYNKSLSWYHLFFPLKTKKNNITGEASPYYMFHPFAIERIAKVNPDIKIKIIWAFTWYDPGKEADAAKTLINQGADILVQHTDTFAPCQEAEKAGVLAFGQASNQEEFCPNSHLTAIEDVWGPYYAARAKAVVDGTWSSTDTWDGMDKGMVVMSPYNAKLMPSDLIQEAVAMEIALKDGSMHSFEGPIYNQAGELMVPEGGVADDGMLLGMNWYVKGIDGELPQ